MEGQTLSQITSDCSLYTWFNKHLFRGARATDVSTAVTNALFLFDNKAPIAVGSTFAYASAAMALSFKAGSYREHRLRQHIIRQRRGLGPEHTQDTGFYLIAFFNFLLLCAAPSCKIASTFHPNSEGLNSPWLYFSCIVAGMISSLYLESQVHLYGEKRTLELIYPENRRATATQTGINTRAFQPAHGAALPNAVTIAPVAPQ
jgi:hypothetical protein